MPMSRLGVLALLFCAGPVAGCTSLGGITDGTSVSYGATSGGALLGAVELPLAGDGYVVPSPWATRGLNWGTEELVGLIVRAGRRMKADPGGGTLYVADLSPRQGGRSAWHRSHQTGRDADLHFLMLDEAGRPVPPPAAMVTFDATGSSALVDEAGNPVQRRRFDVARNWLLVRALLEDPATDVQFLFIYAPLRQMLLDHAMATGEPVDVVARAAAVMTQPGDSLPHDDHLHVRIYCPAGDRSLGCHDRGPVRWLKKDWKYASRRTPAPRIDLALTLAAPMCRLLPAPLLARR